MYLVCTVCNESVLYSKDTGTVPPAFIEIYVWCEGALALFCHVVGILQLEEFSFHSFVRSFIVLYPTVGQF